MLEEIMRTKRPPQTLKNTKAVVPSDETCPDCGGREIKQVGEIRMECRCGFWWNEYSLAGDEERC